MKNKYFPEEDIGKNALFFVCYVIERVARHIHQRNRYVVNAIGKAGLYHLLSVANVLHAENPLKVEDDWIKEYNLKSSDFDNYNCSAFYEPSYVIARAYQAGGF